MRMLDRTGTYLQRVAGMTYLRSGLKKCKLKMKDAKTDLSRCRQLVLIYYDTATSRFAKNPLWQ